MNNYLNFLSLVCISNMQSGCTSSKTKTNDKTQSKVFNLLCCQTSPTHTNHSRQSIILQTPNHENNFAIEKQDSEYSPPEIININPHSVPSIPPNILQSEFYTNKKTQTTSRTPNANKITSKATPPRQHVNTKKATPPRQHVNTKKATPPRQHVDTNQQKRSTMIKDKVCIAKKNTTTQQPKTLNSYNDLSKNKNTNNQQTLPAKKKMISTAKPPVCTNYKAKKENSSRSKETYDSADPNIKTEYIDNIKVETVINEIKKIERIIKKKCLIGNNYEILLKSFITNNFENFENILIMINENENSTYKFFIYDNLAMSKSSKNVPLKSLIIFTQQIYCKHYITEHLCKITKTQHKNVKTMLVNEQEFFGTIIILKKRPNIHIQTK